MSVTAEPYGERKPPYPPGGCHAYIRVRVVSAPRPNGQWLVYLADGTGVIVHRRHLLRINPDPSDRVIGDPDDTNAPQQIDDGRRVSK
jgi:hypothetical protein